MYREMRDAPDDFLNRNCLIFLDIFRLFVSYDPGNGTDSAALMAASDLTFLSTSRVEIVYPEKNKNWKSHGITYISN